jgi:ribosome-associated heat shock protein Hsp15
LVHGQGLRLDKWLWFARLTKSRSDAQRLCESRRLRLDGRVIDRPSALVRAGSVVSFPQRDDVVVVRVLGLAEHRGPFVEACQMYADLTRRREHDAALPLRARDVPTGLTGALIPV